MIRVAGPSFDDLDSQIAACEQLVLDMVNRIMGEVAGELGAVRVAAGKPPPNRLPPPEPTPPSPPPVPGEPAVSLDTLGLIATLWGQEVAGELIPFLREVWDQSADKTHAQLAGMPTPDPTSIQALAEAYLSDAPNRISGFSAEMWDVARAQLLEGFMEGESIDSLRDRLRVTVPELSAARARTIARTEVISASNAGSLSMVELAGFGGTKTWLATEDARTRPTHTLADGQTVPMADAFIVGGFPLHFPGDPSGPLEEIVNCRCTTTYDLDDDPLITAGGAMSQEWVVLEDAPAEEVTELEGAPLTAAAYVLTIPDVPPVDWFDEPTDVASYGALTVTDEGRVYGYLAPAGVPHRGFTERVTAPMGNVDYDLFMGRETLIAGGGRVVTGALTMDCGHASIGFRDPAAAMDHYDNACSIVATARIGENRNGVWVAGALVPGLSANQVSRLMACQLSGDWRPHRQRQGWREFAGALLVPVPGFPMARTEPSVRVREGELVASAVPVQFAGAPTECGCLTASTPEPAPDMAAELETLAASVGLGLATKMDTLRRAVHRAEA